jgi:N-sulfoglucosamine sulfohydrolase
MTGAKNYNIVYIHTHDSGNIFSPYGYNSPTKNIEDFAKEAVVFKKAFCASPTCSPSRSGLLTGMYPHANGMLGLANRGFSLKNYNWHLVSHLKENLYKTVLCGIQHEYGSYSDHKGGAEAIGYDFDITSENNHKHQEDYYLWDISNAENTSEWIRKNGKNGNFFLSFGMFSTHRKFPEVNREVINEEFVKAPYPVPDFKETRNEHAKFLTSVHYADKCFGLVIDALKDSGLYENTIVIFTTDHGIPYPYAKCTLFDSGLEVALIMRVPGSLENGSVTDNLISQIDIFATLCDLTGIEKPERLQGESFAGFFSGKKEKHRDEIYGEINFHTSYEPVRCVRTKNYKYIKYYDKEYLKINVSNIDVSDTKNLLLENNLLLQEKYSEALYDLYNDPGERKNLIDNPGYKDILETLRSKLLQWQKDTDDPLLNGGIKISENWKVNKKTSFEPSSKNPEDYE